MYKMNIQIRIIAGIEDNCDRRIKQSGRNSKRPLHEYPEVSTVVSDSPEVQQPNHEGKANRFRQRG